MPSSALYLKPYADEINNLLTIIVKPLNSDGHKKVFNFSSDFSYKVYYYYY